MNMRRGRVVSVVRSGSCLIESTEPMVCPLCGYDVPRNVRHTCTVDGGVKVVRNLPMSPDRMVADAIEAIVETIQPGRKR